MLAALLLALAVDGQRLAVLEFELAKGVDVDRIYFSDLARSAARKRVPQLAVMTRESTEALLKSQGKTLADCVGTCEVETGKMLGADYVISGRITKVGSRLALTLRLHDTAGGNLLDSEEARGKSIDELLDAADKAIADLLAPLAAPAKEATAMIETKSGLESCACSPAPSASAASRAAASATCRRAT